MLRRAASQEPARIQKHNQRAKAQRVTLTAPAVRERQIAADRAAANIEARLKIAAKKSFQMMGED